MVTTLVSQVEFRRNLEHISPQGKQSAILLAVHRGLVRRDSGVTDEILARALRRLDQPEPKDLDLLTRYEQGKAGVLDMIAGFEAMGRFMAAAGLAGEAGKGVRQAALHIINEFLYQGD